MSFSNYLENAVLNHITGKTAFTQPTVFVGLSSTAPTENGTGITEPTGGSYARVATSGATWSTATTGSTNNASAITFPTATADWVAGANFTHVVLFDAASGGNFLAQGQITTPKPVLNGDTASFAIGNITINLD